MNILVINSGSSTVKYKLYEMPKEQVIAHGIVEIKTSKGKASNNHGKAVRLILNKLKQHTIDAVGHRVVHGGSRYSSAVKIDMAVINHIRLCEDLAPLHNPANRAGIEACLSFMPHIPKVAVFDTAFHQSIQKEAYLYAIPYSLSKKHSIRRYGFHGISHQYVANRAMKLLGKKSSKLVTCHLGNGSSIAAVKNGKSCDTSMGFTPLEGLMMGTRSGDVDPGIIDLLCKKEKMNVHEVMSVLNTKSGLLGVSGLSNDARQVVSALKKGNIRAKLALSMYCRRIAKYIGAYTAAMNGVDAIVFTGGIGENQPPIREEVLRFFTWLGCHCDRQKNRSKSKEKVISTPSSSVKSLVIPPNEEALIARETVKLV